MESIESDKDIIANRNSRGYVSFSILIPLWVLTISAPFFLGYPFSYSNIFFEIAILSILVASIRKNVGRLNLFISIISALYFVLGFLILDRNIATSRDFLISYKSIAYLSIISFASGATILRFNNLVQIYRAWLLLFLFIYLVERFTPVSEFGRPDVFIENNFELAALTILHVGLFSYLGKERHLYHLIVIVITILSGSLSGIAIVTAVTLVLYFSFSPKKAIFFFLLFGLVSTFFFIQLGTRLSLGIGNIDRIIFLKNFILEIQDWGFFNFMFGTAPITPLSPSTCEALSYYQKLFSRTDPDTCFSIVLHSYMLRFIFDHGIVGFVLLFCGVFFAMGKIPLRIRLAIIVVLFLNSISVSSFNSAIIAFSVAAVCTCNYPQTHEKFQKQRKLT